MKTVFKTGLLGLCLATVPPLTGISGMAFAADLPPPPSAMTAPALPMPNDPNAQRIASAAPSPVVSPNGVSPNPMTDPAAADGKGDKKETLSTAENKINDGVKDAIKRLDKTSEDVTLDDLNSARQAVAKIEALIDIEKHLAELEKIRHEREKDSSPMANMIPASALQAPVPVPPQPMGVQVAEQQPMPMVMPRSSLEISRIVGESGHYAAVFKMMGGDEPFKAGSKLPDGTKIVSISPMAVVVEHNGEKQTLHVKNVDSVYGRSS